MGISTAEGGGPADPRSLEQLEPFDDGFAPSTCEGEPARLLRQPPLALMPPHLLVLRDAIGEEEALDVFRFTTARAEPWGTYFKLDGEADDGSLRLTPRGLEPEVERVAELALQSFWRSGEPARLMRPDLRHVHGIGVWAVSGGVGDQTTYHLDYAEVFRRRTNIVAPALHAATLQVSPVDPSAVDGGTFGAHSGGLHHYQSHGWGTRKRPEHDGRPTDDWGDDAGWSYAPYAFRQATLGSGTLPHAASRVAAWPECVRRVVVGINTMGRTEGPYEFEVPQHSEAFRKMLKLEMLCQKVDKVALAKMLLKKRREKLAQAKSNSKAARDGACS